MAIMSIVFQKEWEKTSVVSVCFISIICEFSVGLLDPAIHMIKSVHSYDRIAIKLGKNIFFWHSEKKKTKKPLFNCTFTTVTSFTLRCVYCKSDGIYIEYCHSGENEDELNWMGGN